MANFLSNLNVAWTPLKRHRDYMLTKDSPLWPYWKKFDKLMDEAFARYLELIR